MKIQAKSFLSSVLPRRTPQRRSMLGANKSHPGAISIPSGNLQALAAELHQSATQGLFEYPRNWVLIARVVAFMFVSLGLLRLLLVVLPVVQAAMQGLPMESVAISPVEVAAVCVSMVLAVGFAELLLSLFPAIKVTPQGLGASALFGWRRVRWDQVGVLRVMELEKDRYAVMIPFKGKSKWPTPAPMLRLIPMFAGAARKGEKGVDITSNIDHFDRLLQLIVSYMSQVSGQSAPRLELFLDETAVMPLAQLLIGPEEAIVRLARKSSAIDPYGLPTDDIEPEVNWKRVLPKQALLAAPFALMLLLFEATRQGSTFQPLHLAWAVGLLALGIAELPFVGKLTQTLGEMMVGSGQFKRSVLAYMELQVPRTFLVAIGAALVGVGMPLVLGQILWIAGIGLTTWLAMRFTQRLYYVPLAHTLVLAVGLLVYQITVFALFFGVS